MTPASDKAVEAVRKVLDEHQLTQVLDGEPFGGGLLNARVGVRCSCGEGWSSEHVARVAADAAVGTDAPMLGAEGRKAQYCGCGYCCAANSINTIPGEAHANCSAERDRAGARAAAERKGGQ